MYNIIQNIDFGSLQLTAICEKCRTRLRRVKDVESGGRFITQSCVLHVISTVDG